MMCVFQADLKCSFKRQHFFDLIYNGKACVYGVRQVYKSQYFFVRAYKLSKKKRNVLSLSTVLTFNKLNMCK